MSSQDIYNNPKKKIFSAYDIAFVTGSSPVTHDVKAVLLRNSVDGFIDNFGAGDLIYAVSEDGTVYQSDIYLPSGATDSLKAISAHKIKVTWVADTKYQLRMT